MDLRTGLWRTAVIQSWDPVPPWNGSALDRLVRGILYTLAEARQLNDDAFRGKGWVPRRSVCPDMNGLERRKRSK